MQLLLAAFAFMSVEVQQIATNENFSSTLQSWAQLEEELGAFQRADELRNFRQQSRTEVVMPRTFADPDQIFEPILKQIATWFTRFEVRLYFLAVQFPMS